MGQQPQRFRERLRHQQAVEWVSVMGWQGFEHNNVGIDNRKFRIARCLKMNGGLRARDRHPAATQHMPDRDFPHRCNADVNTVCGVKDEVAGLRIQTWRVDDGPERKMRIE